MQLLFFTVIQIVNVLRILSANVEHSKAPISSVFEAFGYSPACVASALASCELSSKKNFSLNVADSFEVIKSHLQEMKVEQDDKRTHGDVLLNISETLTAISATLEKIKPLNKRPKSCAELDGKTSGLRTVYPYLYPRPVNVYCDQMTDHGFWTVIQNRDNLPLRENFERSWQEYVDGFGNVTGEYWLGLENIHALTSSAQMELRIDLEDKNGKKRYAKYGEFYVGNAASNFMLTIRTYSGNAGDGMTSTNKDYNSNGRSFLTPDRYNYRGPYYRMCAREKRGGWWSNSCNVAHLNGHIFSDKRDICCDGIYWLPYKGNNHSYKKASMKIRPVIRGL